MARRLGTVGLPKAAEMRGVRSCAAPRWPSRLWATSGCGGPGWRTRLPLLLVPSRIAVSTLWLTPRQAYGTMKRRGGMSRRVAAAAAAAVCLVASARGDFQVEVSSLFLKRVQDVCSHIARCVSLKRRRAP